MVSFLISRLFYGLGIVLILLSPCLARAESPDFAEEESATVEEPESDQATEATDVSISDANPSITLTGQVWRTKPGIVFLKTPVGLLTLSSKTTLKNVLASQAVTFWVHDVHSAIDIRKRSDGSLVHRYLGGPFKRSDDDPTKLLRWSPEGEKAVAFGAYERSLADFREGDPITVEVDETDTVIGVHDVQFDLQIGQLPTGRSAAHLILTGTVDKLKSNFIFLRTPLGIINVNAKIGIKNARVGQTMTLYIHERHMVADLSAPHAPSTARRFVTGPLEFAAPDRTSLKLWTPEGEQIVPIDSATHGKTALAGMKEGHSITAELNERGAVVDFHLPH
ncbi:MAG: hypothetical protein NNA30_07770 [Nitrospira sp.]|nr:hypothetical protein [Nitrospira sp.]